MAIEWMTRQQVAKDFGTTTMTLIRWAKSGHGPPFQKPGPGRNAHVRYKRSEYERWKRGEPGPAGLQRMSCEACGADIGEDGCCRLCGNHNQWAGEPRPR
jgi:hypothetical protein